MKNFKLKIIVILLGIISATSCGQNSKSDSKKDTNVVELITVAELENLHTDIQFIDVRTPKEYADGHIKNAKNINFFDETFVEQMLKLNKEEPIYIYCKSGNRSGKASKKLVEAGFIKIYDLEGGFKKWVSEGKKTSK